MGPTDIDWHEAMANATPADCVPVDATDPLYILYTSGTTGRPKGCVLTNLYYLNCGAWYRDLGGLVQLAWGRDRIYNPLPLFHINCQGITAMGAILTANCLILPERFSPGRWWRDIAATGATIVHYLGVVPPLLLNLAPVPEERAHAVKFGLGAGVEPLLHDAFEKRFGFPLIEVWGMTETGRLFADAAEPRQTSTRAFGRPSGGLEARVVDDGDRDVGPETEGELLVRWGGPEGPRHAFFAHYLKNPEATAEAWRGGWFHTGDAAVVHPDGYVEIRDRLKDVIISGGENISSVEVEGTLLRHAAVQEVAIVGLPHELWGEVPHAFVVLKAGAAATGEELRQFARDRLAHFKAPHGVTFLGELPKTATGKVQKYMLRKSAVNLTI
jgi:crotonobetaine/carnitine-CoA ligase